MLTVCLLGGGMLLTGLVAFAAGIRILFAAI